MAEGARARGPAGPPGPPGGPSPGPGPPGPPADPTNAQNPPQPLPAPGDAAATWAPPATDATDGTGTGKAGDFVPTPGVAIPIPPLRQWLIVPGSAGQPRDGNPAACYAMLDEADGTLTFHRVPYDYETAGAKIRAAGIVNAAGGRYVEGAVMTSVPPYRIKVPLLLGGPDAVALEPLLNERGFAARVASDKLGVASATKMCRSVMIKGLEAMVIESFTTARHYGVEDAVIASLHETYPGIDWERQAAYFFQRVIDHGRRRSEEVREVAATVREAGLTPWSASGTAERQAWAVDQVLKAAQASKHLGLKASISFPGALAWPFLYPWPQRPAGLVETAFDELARRWRPILDAYDDAGARREAMGFACGL